MVIYEAMTRGCLAGLCVLQVFEFIKAVNNGHYFIAVLACLGFAVALACYLYQNGKDD